MKTIELTQGKLASVSDEDYEWLSQWKWTVQESKRKYGPSNWYAYRKRNKTETVMMHRQIGRRMTGQDHSAYDHKDGNGLNNQRENIRPCTGTQNGANKTKYLPSSTSRFKGVSWKSDKGKWRATIKLNGVAMHLGYAKTEENAATVYNFSAEQLFGEFASYNTP